MSKFAWVTLTTNDTYSLGALVLAHSLRRAGTAHQLAVLVTPGVSESMRNKLKDVYNVVQEVNVLDSQDAANLALLARPELGITFTKLHCWRLVQFEKCVFLDSDTLVLQNCDELFQREELSAAPDVSWPDCFNSGVFVFKPSLDTYGKITEFALKHGSFDGGDQGLLNSYFADWAHTDIQKHLPFVYNVTAYASYCYLPAFKQFRDKIKILHFAGKLKPWLIQFNSENKTACTPSDYAHAADLIQLWWNIFCESVHQKLTQEMAGLAGALSQLRLGESSTPEQQAYEQLMRRQCWESGKIDYSGKDSFDNIWKKITQTLETKPSTEDDKSEDLALTPVNHQPILTNFESVGSHSPILSEVQTISASATVVKSNQLVSISKVMTHHQSSSSAADIEALSLSQINQLLTKTEAPAQHVLRAPATDLHALRGVSPRPHAAEALSLDEINQQLASTERTQQHAIDTIEEIETDGLSLTTINQLLTVTANELLQQRGSVSPVRRPAANSVHINTTHTTTQTQQQHQQQSSSSSSASSLRTRQKTLRKFK